jgi:hypothetical protein
VTDTWTAERIAELAQLWQQGLTCQQVAAMMGDGISHCAVISKVHRLKLTRTKGYEVRLRENGPKRPPRKKHPPGYAAPWSNRDEQRMRNAKLMRAGGASKTSAAYRKHLPRIGEKSRTELRSMLTAAIQNTAAMEQAQ